MLPTRAAVAAVLALLLCSAAASKPKSAADWSKVVRTKLGDVDAEWSKDDAPEELETDDDALLSEMERRKQMEPNLNELSHE